jgi:lysophospholipid acyltransferase (LPLAT)-like uncharacterized protein
MLRSCAFSCQLFMRGVVRGGPRVLPRLVLRSASISGRLLKSKRVQLAGAWLVGQYLELVLRTTRWKVEGQSELDPYLAGGAVIVAFWHERLPLMPALWVCAPDKNPARPLAALASRHRDGRFLGSLLGRFGVRIVHGSTNQAGSQPGDQPGKRRRDRGGAAGMRSLLAALADGAAIVMTPDGPRGPRRVAAPGVAQLAALSQAPVLPVSGQVRWGFTLNSWDRMVLPLPFGRGVLVCGAPIHVKRDEASAFLPRIEAAMSNAADRADALCGR